MNNINYIRTLVTVKDATETIYHLHEQLGLEIHETSVKVGFDYGGECLKVCLLIMAMDQIGMINEAGTSAKMLKKMKLNSVKKVCPTQLHGQKFQPLLSFQFGRFTSV